MVAIEDDEDDFTFISLVGGSQQCNFFRESDGVGLKYMKETNKTLHIVSVVYDTALLGKKRSLRIRRERN